ncbi:MAG: hypothetical protein QOK28_2311 [Actinomycetota bacterium]
MSPRHLGPTTDGLETYRYIEGRGGYPPFPPYVTSDSSLVGAAVLIRACHDASSNFPTTASQTWQALLADPSSDAPEVICHNDLSTYNTIYRDGDPVALIDWDFAAPGRRLWDLVYAAWWFVPLHHPAYMRKVGWPAVSQPSRLTAFLAAYGAEQVDGDEFLDVLLARQARNRQQLASYVAEGRMEAFDSRNPEVECGDSAYVLSMRRKLVDAVRAASVV